MDQRVALGKYFGESIKDEEKNRPTRGWNRPGLRPGGKAHGVFDGACCILNLHVQSRPGGSTASRWAQEMGNEQESSKYPSFPFLLFIILGM
jgi:hypothetical protein